MDLVRAGTREKPFFGSIQKFFLEVTKMEVKKKFLLVLSFMMAVVLSVAAFAGCQGKKKDSDSSSSSQPSASSNEDEEKYSIEGVYSGLVGGSEYKLNMMGKTFSLIIDGQTLNGTCEYVDDTQASLNYIGGKASIKVEGKTATLTYDGGMYLLYEEIQYTVTFKDGEGQIGTQSVMNGRTATQPEDPEKEGYIFIGWYADGAFAATFDFNELITENTNVYARFTQQTEDGYEYTVTLDYGEKYTGEKVGPLTTIGGIVYGLPTPKQEGENFLGWYVHGNETYKYAGQQLAEDTTLYAEWETSKVVIETSQNGVSWSSKGRNVLYTVEIYGPDGQEVFNVTTMNTSVAFNFSDYGTGVYTVKVLVNNNNPAEVSYTVNGLATPSAFSVEDDVLQWKAVENATFYTISFEYGSGTVEDFEIYNNYFNFSDYDLTPDGLDFYVVAHAEDYVDSKESTYHFDRIMPQVTGVKYVEAEGAITWNEIEEAEQYEVEITVENSAPNATPATIAYNETVGGVVFVVEVELVGNHGIFLVSEPRVTVKGYSGKISVNVRGVAEGYNRNKAEVEGANTLKFEKKTLATPSAITYDGTYISWNSVNNAVSYNLKVGDTVKNTTETKIAVADLIKENVNVYEISVQAVAEQPKNNSIYSDVEVYTYDTIYQEVDYAVNTVFWYYVFNAEYYTVQVNDGEEFMVAADYNFANVTLTRAGENTVTVGWADAEGVKGTATATVFAYQVTYDVQGGIEIASEYHATGDVVELPEAEYPGNNFEGWFKGVNEDGAVGAKYGETITVYEKDITVHAGYTGKEFVIHLNAEDGGYLEGSDNVIVTFNKNYTLPVPQVLNSMQAFVGWFRQPNGQSIQYTDSEGESANGVGAFRNFDDIELYAYYIDVFTAYEVEGRGYSISKNADSNYATMLSTIHTMTVPTTYKGKPILIVNAGEFNSLSGLHVLNIPDSIELIDLQKAFTSSNNIEAVNIYEADLDYKYQKKYASYDGVLYEATFGENAATTKVSMAYFPVNKTGEYKIPAEIMFDTSLGMEGIYKVNELPAQVMKSVKITALTIPYTVTEIGNQAFYLSKLVDITFEAAPEGVEEKSLAIGSQVFQSCTSLEKIVLPTRMNGFDTTMFQGCTALAYIDMTGNSENAYFAKDGAVLTKEDGKTVLVYVPMMINNEVGEFRIPSGVSIIGSGAFNGTRLAKVIIPAYVTEIREEAFAYKSSPTATTYSSTSYLKEVVFEGDDPTPELTIRAHAFDYNAGLEELTLPANLALVEEAAFAHNTKLLKVNVIGNEYTKLETNAFTYVTVNASYGSTTITSYVTEVVLGPEVKDVEITNVFGNKVASVFVDEANPNYYSEDNVLYDHAKTTIYYVPLSKAGTYVVPETVKSIPAMTFMSRTSLNEVSLPDTITEIGESAFQSCSALTSVNFYHVETEEVGNLKIGANAFYSCSKITEIELPANTYEIGNSAFYSCSALKKITIPANVKYMGEYEEINGEKELTNFAVLNNTNALQEIIVEEGNENFVTYGGALYIANDGVPEELIAFPRARAGVVDIAPTTKKIWDRALYNCDNVTDVTFSQGLAEGVELEIGSYAIADMGKLKKLTLPKGTKSLADHALYYNTALEELNLGEGIESYGEYCFYYCSALKELTIPAGATVIIEKMFYYCRSLTTITIPYTVEEIQSQAFASCAALQEVIFEETPEGVDPVDLVIADGVVSGDSTGSYYYGVFSDCTKLTKIELPERTTYIGMYAFYNVGIQDFVVPASVTELGNDAFYQPSGSKAFKNITFKEGSQLKSIGYMAFYYTNVEEIVLPEGLETLYAYSFYYANKLKKVYIPSTVTEIGAGVKSSPSSTTSSYGRTFYYCSELEEVTIAEGSKLEKINTYDFYNCKKLAKIELPETLKVIDTYAFNTCPALKEVTFRTYTEGENAGKSDLESVGNYAFASSGLVSFAYPETTADKFTNGTYVFQNCKALQSVYLSSKVPSVTDCFNGCSSLTTISVSPDSQNFSTSTDGLSILYNKFNENAKDKEILLVYGTVTGEFEIPDGTYRIGQRAFQNQVEMTKVVIPSTMMRIDHYAFAGCVNLEEVEFTNSAYSELTTIGTYVFQGCSKLKSITIPGAVTILGASGTNYTYSATAGYVFSNCSSLEEVNFPAGIKSIGGYSFQNCTSLKSINIPNTVTQIGNYAFSNSGLTSVTIPSSVTTFGTYMFDGCKSLESITFPTTSKTYGTYMFRGCTALTEVNLPAAQTSISTNMFQNCTGLTKLVLPAKLTSMGNYAFAGCSSLEEVTMPNNITTTGTYWFQNCTSLTTVNFAAPASFTKFGNYAFYGCTALENIELPSGLTGTGLAAYTFQNCTSLKEITIPAKVTYIGASVSSGSTFYGCTSLEKVTLGAAVTNISPYAFRDCTSLKEIVFNDKLTQIGQYAFQNCTSLEEITIPAKVNIIGGTSTANAAAPSYGRTFDGCTSLKKFTWETGTAAATLGGATFNGCTALEEVTLNGKLTTIGSIAFNDCSSLKKIVIPEGVINMGSYTFYGCTALKEVTMPKNIEKTITTAAPSSGLTATSYTLTAIIATTTTRWFDGCTALETVTFADPDSFKLFGTYTFNGCTSLKNIEIPSGLTELGTYTFQNCTSLERAVIPKGITKIGGTSATTASYVFNGCTSLKEVVFDDDCKIEYFGTYTFQNCSALESINLPDTLYAMGNYTFNGCSSLTEIVIPAKVTAIPQFCFNGNSSLEKVTFLGEITDLAYCSFQSCPNLVGFTIPNTVTHIGSYALHGCTGISTIYIPASVTMIDGQISGSNTSLVNGYEVDAANSVYYSDETGAICTYDGVLVCAPPAWEGEYTVNENIYEIGTYAFNACTKITKIELPESVTTIDSYAFRATFALEELIMTDSVESIGTYAFERSGDIQNLVWSKNITTIPNYLFRDSSIKNVVFPDTIVQMGIYVFDGASVENVYLPASIRRYGTSDTTYTYFFNNVTTLKSVEFEDGAIIPSYMFRYAEMEEFVVPATVELRTYAFAYNRINKIIVSEGITELPNNMFYYAETDEVVLPEGLENMGRYTFYYSSVRKANVPSTVIDYNETSTTTYGYTFNNDKALEEVTLAEGLTKLSMYMFSGCTALKEVYIPGSVTEYTYPGSTYGYTFNGCTALEKATLGEGLKTTAPRMFQGCSALTEVNLPSTLETISDYTFNNNSSLTEIDLPSNLTSIGNYAFQGCTALANIKLPATLKTLGNYAFDKCAEITELELPEGLEEIGTYAFQNCTGLKHLDIPSTVTFIGMYAFAGCTTMKSIYIPINVETLNQFSFRNWTAEQTIYIAYEEGMELMAGWHANWHMDAATTPNNAPVVYGVTPEQYAEVYAAELAAEEQAEEGQPGEGQGD